MKPDPMPNAPPRQRTSDAPVTAAPPSGLLEPCGACMRPTLHPVRITRESTVERSLPVIPRSTTNRGGYSYDNLAVGMSSSTMHVLLPRRRTPRLTADVRSPVLHVNTSPWRPRRAASNRRRWGQLERHRPSTPPRPGPPRRAAWRYGPASHAHMKYLTAACSYGGLTTRCGTSLPSWSSHGRWPRHMAGIVRAGKASGPRAKD
jgi:hypothetical protein